MGKCVRKYFLIAVAILGCMGAMVFHHYHTKDTWQDALTYYGFSTSVQKKAFTNLLKEASIQMDPPTWEVVFSPQKKQKQLLEDILKLVQETQSKFTVRTGTQERWEVKPLPWMKNHTSEILDDLTHLGFVTAVEPQIKNPDAICILGATAGRMGQRIAYVDQLLSRGISSKLIILLSGERYVTSGVDGSEETLQQLAQRLGIGDWTRLTEAHLAQELYNTSLLATRDIRVHLINTPAGDLPRPTTQTTVLELINWLKQHPEVRRLVFVSNQPHVHYQQAIIRSIFEGEGYPIEFEVIGAGVENTDKVLPLLEGLGSYLWAASPRVLFEMGISLKDPAYKKAFQKLYEKNPLIYKMLSKSFL